MGRPATYASGEKSASKYRALYAEPESALSDELRSLSISFGHGLAIPSFGEGGGIAPGLGSLRPGQDLTRVTIPSSGGAQGGSACLLRI